MASHAVLQPGECFKRGLPTRFLIAASCQVSAIIMQARSQNPPSSKRLKISAAFYPLSMAGFVIADLLLDNE